MSDSLHPDDDWAPDPVDEAMLQALEQAGRDMADIPSETRDQHMAAIMRAVAADSQDEPRPTWRQRLRRLLGLTTAQVTIGAVVAGGAVAGMAAGGHVETVARGIGVDGLQRFGPTTPEFDVGVTNPSTPSPDGAGGNSMVDPGAYPEPGHGVEDAVGGRDDQPGPAGTSGSTPAQTVLPSDAPVPDLAAIRQAAEPTNLEDLLNLDLDHLELGIIAGDASDPGQDRGGDLAGVVDDIDSVVDEVVPELDLPALSGDGDTGDPARDGLDLSDPIGPIVDVPDVDIPLLGDSDDGDGPASDGPDAGASDVGGSDAGASDAGASDSSGDDLLDTDLLTGDDGVIGGLFGGDPAG